MNISHSNKLRVALAAGIIAISAVSLTACVSVNTGEAARQSASVKSAPFPLADGEFAYSRSDDKSGEGQIRSGSNGLKNQRDLLVADGYDVTDKAGASDGRFTAKKSGTSVDVWKDGETIRYSYTTD
ncbi:hypothetical protein [Leifsonia sp. SIMBA_070]|uniref:hypothetical protein n=1 Tax=Leifsonia sp. SIMBA_070 TaxID=3085810 RepID=UPI00397D634C